MSTSRAPPKVPLNKTDTKVPDPGVSAKLATLLAKSTDGLKKMQESLKERDIHRKKRGYVATPRSTPAAAIDRYYCSPEVHSIVQGLGFERHAYQYLTSEMMQYLPDLITITQSLDPKCNVPTAFGLAMFTATHDVSLYDATCDVFKALAPRIIPTLPKVFLLEVKIGVDRKTNAPILVDMISAFVIASRKQGERGFPNSNSLNFSEIYYSYLKSRLTAASDIALVEKHADNAAMLHAFVLAGKHQGQTLAAVAEKYPHNISCSDWDEMPADLATKALLETVEKAQGKTPTKKST